MLTKRDIICFSSIDWDFIWQGHQEIMQRLARAGNRVLFIENTGVRAPQLRDLPRIKRRWRNWRRGIQGIRQVEAGLYVYAPLVVPLPYSRWARRINRWLITLSVHPWMRAVGFKRPIAWVYLPTPLTLELLELFEPALTIYYCFDNFVLSSPMAKKVAHAERQLIRQSDLVFVTSRALRDHCARWSSRVYEFPSGVDLEFFDAITAQNGTTPADLDALPRPRVGYLGGLHRWVDQQLLRTVAQQCPKYAFVFVGPTQTDVSLLADLPNVHLLGFKAREDIPRYIRGFDIGIIPYYLTDYTNHVYPTKLNEYFALGRPVVSTALPEVVAVAREAQGGVLIAHAAEEFAQHVSRLLGNGDEHHRQQLRAIAEQNSWATKVARMSELIEESLAQRWQDQETGWAERLLAFSRVAVRRLARIACVLAIAYGVLFHTPALWWIAAPLKLAQPPAHADTIVVFAGGVGESGKAGQGYEERVLQAVSLYRQGYARQMIVSSGYRYALHEAEVMKALAVSLGVPSDAITVEESAVNTRDNVRYSAALLRRGGWHSALVVSSPYHMRRVALVWRKAAPDLQAIWAPVVGSRFFGNQQRVLLRHWQAIAHEYLSILDYWLKGWI